MNHTQTPHLDPVKNWIVPILIILAVMIVVLGGVFVNQAVIQVQAAGAIPTPALVHLENSWITINGAPAYCARCDFLSPQAVTVTPSLAPSK